MSTHSDTAASSADPLLALPKSALLGPRPPPTPGPQQPFALYVKLPLEFFQAFRDGDKNIRLDVKNPESLSLDIDSAIYNIDILTQPTAINLYKTSSTASEIADPSASPIEYTNVGKITNRLMIRGTDTAATLALKSHTEQIRKEMEANRTTLIPIKENARMVAVNNAAAAAAAAAASPLPIPSFGASSSSTTSPLLNTTTPTSNPTNSGNLSSISSSSSSSSNLINSGSRTPLLNISASPSRASSASPTSSVLRNTKPKRLKISKPLISKSISSSPNRLIHLLALGPLSFETLFQKTKISQPELENLLKQYAHNDSAAADSSSVAADGSSPTATSTDLYSLQDSTCKDLRVWDWKHYTPAQREQVIRNTTAAYDRLGLPADHPCRLKLIDPKIRHAEKAAADAALEAKHRAEDAAKAAERKAAEQAEIERVEAEMAAEKEERAAAAAARNKHLKATVNGTTAVHGTTGLGISGVSPSMLQKAVKSTTKRTAARTLSSSSSHLDSVSPPSASGSPLDLNVSGGGNGSSTTNNNLRPPSPPHPYRKGALSSSAVSSPASSPALLAVGANITNASTTSSTPLTNPKTRRNKSISPVYTDSDDSASTRPINTTSSSSAITSGSRKRRATAEAAAAAAAAAAPTTIKTKPTASYEYNNNDSNDTPNAVNDTSNTNDENEEHVRKRQALGTGSVPARTKQLHTATIHAVEVSKGADDGLFSMAARFRRLYAQYEALYRQLEKQGYIPSVNGTNTIKKSEVNARDLKRLLQLHKDLNTLKQRLWSTQPPKGLTKNTTANSKVVMNDSAGTKPTNFSNDQTSNNKLKVNGNGIIKKLTNTGKRTNNATGGARSSPRSPIMPSLSPSRSPAREVSVSPPRGTNGHQQQSQYHGSTKLNAHNGTGSSSNGTNMGSLGGRKKPIRRSNNGSNGNGFLDDVRGNTQQGSQYNQHQQPVPNTRDRRISMYGSSTNNGGGNMREGRDIGSALNGKDTSSLSNSTNGSGRTRRSRPSFLGSFGGPNGTSTATMPPRSVPGDGGSNSTSGRGVGGPRTNRIGAGGSNRGGN